MSGEQDQHAALVARLREVSDDLASTATYGARNEIKRRAAASKAVVDGAIAALAASPAGASEPCSLEDDCQCEACVRERGLVNRDGTVLKLTRYGRAAYDAGKAAGASAQEEIEAAWKMIEQCYSLEPRALIEAEAKTNGLQFGLVQAVFSLWKREAKPAGASERRVTREQANAIARRVPSAAMLDCTSSKAEAFALGWGACLTDILALFDPEVTL